MRLRSLKHTTVVKVDPGNPDGAIIERAARIVRQGGLVAFPTETVYGIAADLSNKKAIDRLYRIKNRPDGKPFTVHIAGVSMIRSMGCSLPRKVKRAIDKLWPGPLTAIVKSTDGRKIGFRMPANEVALRLIDSAKVPVVAPSANISGNRPPQDAEGVLRELDGKVDLLLDAGSTEVGIESTVVDFTVDPPIIVRQGAITRASLFRALKG